MPPVFCRSGVCFFWAPPLLLAFVSLPDHSISRSRAITRLSCGLLPIPAITRLIWRFPASLASIFPHQRVLSSCFSITRLPITHFFQSPYPLPLFRPNSIQGHPRRPNAENIG